VRAAVVLKTTIVIVVATLSTNMNSIALVFHTDLISPFVSGVIAGTGAVKRSHQGLKALHGLLGVH